MQLVINQHITLKQSWLPKYTYWLVSSMEASINPVPFFLFGSKVSNTINKPFLSQKFHICLHSQNSQKHQMALRMIEIGLVLVLAAMLWGGVATGWSWAWPQPKLHYRKLINPIIFMLLTARQRRSITASMPVLGAQWWWCDVRYQCKPNSCSSSPGACYVQTPLASQCNGKAQLRFIPRLMLIFC